ncbi:UNVERIFIED_CONTAM: hypothetical protein K2H54_054674 [Gekko kuhli]
MPAAEKWFPTECRRALTRHCLIELLGQGQLWAAWEAASQALHEGPMESWSLQGWSRDRIIIFILSTFQAEGGSCGVWVQQLPDERQVLPQKSWLWKVINASCLEVM